MKCLEGFKTPCLASLVVVLSISNSGCGDRSEGAPPITDYCERLQQEVQGKKHGFLAGNVSYYIGGFHASWNPIEDETIGLTHPFCHDLRSRGVGLLESELQGSEHTGVGNDFSGWEFYKDTRVLYGTVIVDGEEFEHPVPEKMYWRPDKMVCEYTVAGVQIREEKFIGANDAAASIITSSRPVILRFSGNSFFVRDSVTSTASIENRVGENVIAITEGGTVKSRPDPNGPERIGPIVYEGMTTVLSASRDFSNNVTFRDGADGEKHYQFEVPCDHHGVTVSWAMHDDASQAIQAAREIIEKDSKSLEEKTESMNELLSRGIPQFRCSDKKFEDIYYYLWALYLMYYIDVQSDWEMENHTQTAVNNFLGIHRYDACFQIKVGAWAADKPRFAYGNVLTWKHLVENGRYRELPNGLILLSDNKGTTWHSGAYGAELSEHVLGAWQIYEHTGDIDFIRHCYEGYFRKVFWKAIPGFAMNQFEVADVLEKMASATGHKEDAEHWLTLVRREPEHIRRMFDQRWGVNGNADYFAGGKDGMLMTNAFWSMRSKHFPREYAEKMVSSWALDRDKGFLGEIFPRAMSAQSMTKFATPVDHSFGYTPDTAYFTLDGMFCQGLSDTASELTLDHLSKYNFNDEWGIPVAPEAYQRDLKLFGDQYSNFNAGKILLFLEGIAGVSYSVTDETLRVRDALPKAWDWMELDIPITAKGQEKVTWTKVRIERRDSTKSIEVENSPFDVILEPSLENRVPEGEPDLTGHGVEKIEPSQPGRISYRFPPSGKKTAVSQLLQ
ncbi:hypothetical protein N9B21_02605 [Verrucomicrobiales bacterium]|nr:hypothetical protein [Verrucomicrobiales bacterium]